MMQRGEKVILGDVHEGPMPTIRVDDLREALSLCDCKGVARSGDLAVKVSARAVRTMEKSSAAVSPLSCAGALLGTVYQVGENWLVDVQEALPFNATPEVHRVRVPRHAWQEMLSARKEQFPDMRVVGWYHSHPGYGASFSDADAFVQRFFFPADWQVAAVVDPDRRDLQFFSRRGRNVSALGAYWIERGVAESTRAAAPAAPSSSPSPERAAPPPPKNREGRPPVPQQPELLDAQQTSETYLKERFVERSLEKILRLLKEPPLTLRDFAMMGMMGLMLVVLVVTRIGSSSSSADLKDITQRLDKISQRLESMQTAPASVPAKAASAPATAAKPAATEPVEPKGQKAPADGEADVEHVMQPGESLWSVAQQYYGDGAHMNALMRYNKIADARDLPAGVAIKVPSAKKLGISAKGGAAPPPTPH